MQRTEALGKRRKRANVVVGKNDGRTLRRHSASDFPDVSLITGIKGTESDRITFDVYRPLPGLYFLVRTGPMADYRLNKYAGSDASTLESIRKTAVAGDRAFNLRHSRSALRM